MISMSVLIQLDQAMPCLLTTSNLLHIHIDMTADETLSPAHKVSIKIQSWYYAQLQYNTVTVKPRGVDAHLLPGSRRKRMYAVS